MWIGGAYHGPSLNMGDRISLGEEFTGFGLTGWGPHNQIDRPDFACGSHRRVAQMIDQKFDDPLTGITDRGLRGSQRGVEYFGPDVMQPVIMGNERYVCSDCQSVGKGYAPALLAFAPPNPALDVSTCMQ